MPMPYSDEPQTKKYDQSDSIGLKNDIEKSKNNLKNYILQQGRRFVDFIAVLDITISIIIFIAGIIMGISESSWTPFWSCTGIAFLYYQITLIKNYVVYLFIDMRDSLKELAKKYEIE